MEPGGVSNASEHRKILLQDFESLLTYVLLLGSIHTSNLHLSHLALQY